VKVPERKVSLSALLADSKRIQRDGHGASSRGPVETGEGRPVDRRRLQSDACECLPCAGERVRIAPSPIDIRVQGERGSTNVPTSMS
jgi:hypothetical protein